MTRKLNGTLLGHVGCPIHGSTDSLALYLQKDGKIDGYCWSECGYVETDILIEHDVLESCGTKVKVEFAVKANKQTGDFIMTEDLKEKLHEVESQTTFKGWRDRNITTATTKRYKVRTKVDHTDAVTHRYYPATLKGELVGYHVRDVKAKELRKLRKTKRQPFFPIGNVTTQTELFGQNLFSRAGKFIVITEGEEDAMAIYQALKTDEYETAVVSSTIGSKGAIAQIRHKSNYDYISSFQRIVVFPDQDDAGREMADELRKMFGSEKLYVAELKGYKDACEAINDSTIDGHKLIRTAFWNAVPNTPSAVVTIDDIFESALKLPEMGLSFPWPSLTEKTLGLRKGEMYVIAAAPKVGKTEFQHQLAKHLTEVHGEKVGVMSLEENPVKTAKKIAGKYARKQFTKPPEIGGYTMDELREGLELIRGKIEFYRTDGDRGIDAVLETIRYWASEGISYIFIDPLTALIAEFSASEANDVLNKLMSNLASIVMELDITLFLFSHVNPVKSGTPHDQGGDVLSSQITGSRAIEKWCHYGIAIQRNRYETDPIKRNTARLNIMFDREYGEYCEFYCFYDSELNDWSEVPAEFNGERSAYIDPKTAFNDDVSDDEELGIKSSKVDVAKIESPPSDSEDEWDDWDVDLSNNAA